MAKPSRFWYPQCDPGQEDRVRQVEQRFVQECGVKRLPRAAAENRECGGAGDQRAMECKSAEADVECLRGVKEKIVATQRYIIGTSSDDREEHDPGCGINHPIGIQANSGGKGSRYE